MLNTTATEIKDPPHAIIPICGAPFKYGCIIGTKLDGLVFFDPVTKTFTTLDNSSNIGKYNGYPDGEPHGVWFVSVDEEDNVIYYVTGKKIFKITYDPNTKTFGTPVNIYTAADYIVGFTYRKVPGMDNFFMTVKNQGFYRSVNGTSWTEIIMDPLDTSIKFRWQMWIHITSKGAVYTAACKHTAFYNDDVFDAIVSIGNNSVPRHLWLQEAPLWKSTDGGITWKNVFNMSAGGNVERTWVQSEMMWNYYFMLNSFQVIPGETAEHDTIYVYT